MTITTSVLRLEFTGGPTGPFSEEVHADFIDHRPDCDVYELRCHATFVPLAPRDRVRVVDGVITAIERLHPGWTIEATLHLPAATTFGHHPSEEHPALKAVAEVQAQWQQHALVTRNTAFSFLVTSDSRKWLEANVDKHRYVEHVDLIRGPAGTVDLAWFLAHPAF